MKDIYGKDLEKDITIVWVKAKVKRSSLGEFIEPLLPYEFFINDKINSNPKEVIIDKNDIELELNELTVEDLLKPEPKKRGRKPKKESK